MLALGSALGRWATAQVAKEEQGQLKRVEWASIAMDDSEDEMQVTEGMECGSDPAVRNKNGGDALFA